MVFVAIINTDDKWEMSPRVCAVNAPDRRTARRWFVKHAKDLTKVTDNYCNYSVGKVTAVTAASIITIVEEVIE